jgi:hypothetical protein
LQDENTKISTFIEHTDKLAQFYRCSLRELGPKIEISPALLFGGRSGKIPISLKTWAKLDQAMRSAGVQNSGSNLYPDDHSGSGVQLLKDAEKPITAADFAETKDRIKTLEEKLDLLLKHLGAKP